LLLGWAVGWLELVAARPLVDAVASTLLLLVEALLCISCLLVNATLGLMQLARVALLLLLLLLQLAAAAIASLCSMLLQLPLDSSSAVAIIRLPLAS